MNKVYDYMMSAKPILYGIDARNNDVLDAQCGLSFSSDDLDTFAEQLYILKNSPKEELKKMGENGKKWVLQNCEYTILANKFLSLMKDNK